MLYAPSRAYTAHTKNYQKYQSSNNKINSINHNRVTKGINKNLLGKDLLKLHVLPDLNVTAKKARSGYFKTRTRSFHRNRNKK